MTAWLIALTLALAVVSAVCGVLWQRVRTLTTHQLTLQNVIDALPGYFNAQTEVNHALRRQLNALYRGFDDEPSDEVRH